MLLFLLNILYLSTIISNSLSINPSHRSLLSNNAYNYITNITLEITSINTSDSSPIIINTIYNQLNSYYNTIYNSSLNYNLSIITSTTSTTKSIELMLLLYTKSIITRNDMNTLQIYIDNNISINNLYIINIIHFTEHRNSGNIKDNELQIEILIIVFAILFIIIFIGIWIWKWRRNVYKNKAEVYFLEDYNIKKEPELKNNHTGSDDKIDHKKGKQIEMSNATKDNDENKNENKDKEIDINDKNTNENVDENVNENVNENDENLEERDEDDEKAEELELPTETINNGENILIEEDD